MDRFEHKLSWNSLKDNLVEDFYLPALKDAIIYQRKQGFFHHQLSWILQMKSYQ